MGGWCGVDWSWSCWRQRGCCFKNDALNFEEAISKPCLSPRAPPELREHPTTIQFHNNKAATMADKGAFMFTIVLHILYRIP